MIDGSTKPKIRSLLVTVLPSAMSLKADHYLLTLEKK